MSDVNEQAQMLEAARPADMGRGQLLGTLANYRLTPEQEAAQREAAAKADAEWRAREAQERADVQSRLDRETRQAAVHAALMIEGERATAEEVLTNAAKFATFLNG